MPSVANPCLFHSVTAVVSRQTLKIKPFMMWGLMSSAVRPAYLETNSQTVGLTSFLYTLLENWNRNPTSLPDVCPGNRNYQAVSDRAVIDKTV